MTTTPAEALLSAENLVKRYGSVVALDGVSFDITDGITGILGENGAGKSTSIRIFLGLLTPTSGTARILGEDVRDNVRARSRLGYMPEHDCLPTHVSAAEFLTHMAEVSGLPPSTARTRAADTLRHTGLFEERYRAIGGYSTGMKQRVKLAQALVHDPAFVFLDEPTAGLDPVGREEMLQLVRKTYLDFGISVLFSSHLMADVERTCDRILVLRDGRLVQSGEVGRFTDEAATLFIEVDGNRERLVAALERRGVEVTPDGGGFLIESPDDSAADHVRDALVEAEAPLRRMAPRRRELSELFRRDGDGARTRGVLGGSARGGDGARGGETTSGTGLPKVEARAEAEAGPEGGAGARPGSGGGAQPEAGGEARFHGGAEADGGREIEADGEPEAEAGATP